jgi:cytochrome c-type biogenesis protein CcmH
MRSLIILIICVVFATAHAQSNDQSLDQRTMRLAAEMRCLVCQNQTLADSNAPLANDLKKELREKLASGMTDQQVIDFMVQRYGDFVLYKPPLQANTWLLWFGPFLLLVGGLLFLILKIRQRQAEEAP